jgi:hypothetical protein
MPGGYAGSGRFFPCRLEKTAPGERRWVSVADGRVSERLRGVMTLEPGTRSRVCSASISKAGWPGGTCGRFVLRLRWAPSSAGEVHSPPFALADGHLGPCVQR